MARSSAASAAAVSCTSQAVAGSFGRVAAASGARPASVRAASLLGIPPRGRWVTSASSRGCVPLPFAHRGVAAPPQAALWTTRACAAARSSRRTWRRRSSCRCDCAAQRVSLRRPSAARTPNAAPGSWRAVAAGAKGASAPGRRTSLVTCSPSHPAGLLPEHLQRADHPRLRCTAARRSIAPVAHSAAPLVPLPPQWCTAHRPSR